VPKERKKERKSKTLTKEEEEARRELKTSSSSEEKKERRRRREIQQFHLRWNAHHSSSRCLRDNWRRCGRQQQKRRVAMAGLPCCGYGAFDERAAGAAATTSRTNARERERRSGWRQTGPGGPARPSLFFRGCLSLGLTGVCGVRSLQRFFF
jgi:hypothetical protein